jgi:glycosyltransferase involved in cell wall biosynthesis
VLNFILVDNGSTDGSKVWLTQNKIPFISLTENIGHEQAINHIYPLIRTKYALICDTDIEFFANIVDTYIPLLNSEVKLIGDYITGDQLDSPVKPRVGAWFYLFDIEAMRLRGWNVFRDSNDWSYDVGSFMTEKILEAGFKIHHIQRLNQDIDHELISMRYTTHNHIGKVSWDIEKHSDRHDEVVRRRKYIEEKLIEYSDIDLQNKFTL